MLHASSTQEITPRFKPEKTIAEQIAEAMIDLNADGGATEDRLRERGFSQIELDMYGAEARALANQSFVRRVDRYRYNRPLRVNQAAQLIGHLIPSTQEICAALQSRSFTKYELDDILPDAIAKAADDFAHAGGAQ